MLRTILIALFLGLAGCSPPTEQPAENPAQVTGLSDNAQAASRDKFTIVIAGDSWCPYNCLAESAREGYSIDVAREVFALAGYKIKYLNVSWARAIQLAREGHIDAVAVAFTGDAPDFVFPQEPIGLSRTHFYTNAASRWAYTGIASLQGQTLLAINGYFYSPELDAYIARNLNDQNRVWILSGPAPLNRAISLLDQHRADIYLEDELVMSWALQAQSDLPPPRDAGEVYQAPVFIAFSPANPDAAELARVLSDGTRAMRKSGQLGDIMASYGLPLFSVD
ncbi:ABC transporter substrate-binding protein [Marinobacter sp. 1_MG-2023]|uniref:substrate-binding periplasmic protein n=1 Tax=Marinobacter sp. 1_MG-2023 TaxID=3062627 RepID=UPI0026E21D21|nr:ABC transporter substrate-binding protein [Marinobacter sp. 1_MG-2023]MDO6822411.1 ABC transporter substrate-binding protein [Marinobacter sp. 1_MG-2023]